MIRALALTFVAAALAGCAEVPEAQGQCKYFWTPGDDEAVLVALVGPNGHPVEAFGIKLAGDEVSSEATTDDMGCVAFHVPRGEYHVEALGKPSPGCFYSIKDNHVELRINVAEYEMEVREICTME